MKTFGRIIIILAMFALVMGITYAVVNGNGSSSSELPQFPNGERPEFDGRFEGRPEGGGGWAFGLIKNLGIVATVTALIAVPRNWMRNKRTATG